MAITALTYQVQTATLGRLNVAAHHAGIIVQHLGAVTIYHGKPWTITDLPAFRALPAEAAETVRDALAALNVFDLGAPGIRGIGATIQRTRSWDNFVEIDAESVAALRAAVTTEYARLDAAVRESWAEHSAA